MESPTFKKFSSCMDYVFDSAEDANIASLDISKYFLSFFIGLLYTALDTFCIFLGHIDIFTCPIGIFHHRLFSKNLQTKSNFNTD